MKVTCQLCGTKFYTEKNGGRCPGCASLYRKDGVGVTYTYNQNLNCGEYDGDYDEYEDDDYEYDPQMQEYYQNLRNEENKKWIRFKKVVKGILITIEVIIIIFFLLMPALGRGYSDLRLEEQSGVEKPPIVEAFRNKPIYVGDYEVTITNYYVDRKENWNLPDNYIVYAVEYESDFAGDEYDYSGQSLYQLVEPYLETDGGPTITPIDSYHAGENMVYEKYKLIEDKVGDYIKFGGGILYYVVKEDESIYGLCFDTYTGRENDYNYRELDRIYFMEAPELEVK